MKPFVFLIFPAHGHVNPSLPIVRELVALGRRVVYFSAEEMRDKIVATGAEFRKIRGVGITDKNVGMLWNLVRFFCFLLRSALSIASLHAEEIAGLDPECLIYDSIMPAGKIIALRFGIKHVSSVTIPVFSARSVRSLVSPSILLREFGRNVHRLVPAALRLVLIRLRFGVWLDPFSFVQNEAPLNIVYTSSYFQPDSHRLGDRFFFAGPSIAKRDDQNGFPLERLDRGNVVCISMGTILNDKLDFYRDCLDWLGGTEYTVVLAVGRSIDRNALEPVPPNFIIREQIPQLDVLERTGVFISHSGMNSVQEALYFGVPLILLPQTLEQAFIADRVVELGAGIRVDSAAELKRALGNLDLFFRDDSSYRNQALTIGRTLREAGGFRQAVSRILAYCS